MKHVILLLLVIVVAMSFGAWAGYDAGKQAGAMKPIESTYTVEMEKVIGWCMIAGTEDLIEMGASPELLKENLSEIREECEDRWLAFSKRWERGEIE